MLAMRGGGRLQHRVMLRCYSHELEAKWIKETFRSPSLSLRLPDVVRNGPNMNRKQIDEACKSQNCIIDTSDAVMGLPLIDADAQKWIEEIEKHSWRQHSWGLLCGIAHGKGGGKTRALEEMRRHLLQRPDTLPLAITFISPWDIKNDEWDKHLRLKYGVEPSMFLTLSVISRMASMLYNESLASIQQSMINNMAELVSHRNSYLWHDFLFEEFLKYIAQDVAMQRERPVTKLIVLIDETMRAVKHVDDVYGPQDDILRILRNALMDERHEYETKEGQVMKLNVSLALSSLEYEPVFIPPLRQKLGRPYEARLPGNLDVARVCDEIFLKHTHTLNVLPEDKIFFQRIAATLNDRPRLIEYANRYISENIFPQDREAKSTYFIKLYESVINQCVGDMPNLKVVDELLFYSVVYGIEVRTSKPVLNAVTDGLLTKVMHGYKDSTPKTSLTVLYAASRDIAKFSDLCEPLQGIFRIIAESANAKKLLVTSLIELLRVKLITACAAVGYKKQDVELMEPGEAPKKLTVRMLLRILSRTGSFCHLFNLLDTSLRISHKLQECIAVHALCSKSLTKSDGFINELKSCEVDKKCSVGILRAAEGDAWDVGLKVFDAKAATNPVYIFIDCTSHLMPRSKLSKQEKRYNYMKSFCEKHNLRFSYVCLCTEYVDEEKYSDDIWQETLNVMRKAESEQFLGPIYQLFALNV